MKNHQKGEVVIYKGKKGFLQLKVKLEEDTVWLNQKQMAELFQVERSVITKHIKNTLITKELKKNEVSAIFAHTASDGKVYKTYFYNLDMIIAVGYRVNSVYGTQFRICANKIIHDYLVKGFLVNQNRLKQKQKIKLSELQRTILLLQDVMKRNTLEKEEATGFLEVMTDYTKTWVILNNYDRKSLQYSVKTNRKAILFSYEKAKELIFEFKKDLQKRKQVSKFFGVEKDVGLSCILENLNQEIVKEPIYKSIEEKAAHLFYLIIKDKVFIDGNKRIASFLLLLFLKNNNLLYNKKGEKVIDSAGLIALALLVSESRVQEKDVIISLIINLLRK